MSQNLSEEQKSHIRKLAKYMLAAGYLTLIFSVILTAGILIFLAPVGILVMLLSLFMIRTGKTLAVSADDNERSKPLEVGISQLTTVFKIVTGIMALFSLWWVGTYLYVMLVWK